MSLYYKKGNLEKTIQLFSKRVMYDDLLDSYPGQSLVDFNRGEKFFYGRVDRRFRPVITHEDLTIFKSFKRTTGQGSATSMRALDFVVDAFGAMALQFEKCAATGKIATDDPYLSSLVVHKAYQDPYLLYEEYKVGYFNGLASAFVTKKTGLSIRNFKEFLSTLMTLLEKSAPTIPFTLPAFIKSRRCPINVSGLAVEISPMDASNDEEKVRQFVSSKNWQFYLNACKSYGFSVDRANPWRLVADIGSPEMMKYGAKAKSRINRTGKIFRKAYVPAHQIYTESNDFFKADLLKLYNMSIQKQHNVTHQDCGSGTLITKFEEPERYDSVEALQDHMNIHNLSFSEVYFRIRFMEEETGYTQAERDNLIRDALSIKNTSATPATGDAAPGGPGIIPLGYFETILSKPFDYRGSLTYNNTIHLPAWRKENMDIDEADIETNTTSPETESSGPSPVRSRTNRSERGGGGY